MTPSRATRPALEGLEDRILLYSTTRRPVDLRQPDHLQLHARRHERRRHPEHPVPDPQRGLRRRRPGSSNSRRPPPLWEAVADINLVLVSDNGAAVGSRGNQQGDSRFGDIRIGGHPAGVGHLGVRLPAPADQRRHRSPATSSSTPTSDWRIGIELRPDDRRDPRVRPRAGPGPLARSPRPTMYATYNGDQAGADHRRHRRHPVDLRPAPARSVRQQRPSNNTYTTATNITRTSTATPRSPSPGWTSPRPATATGSTSRCPPRRPAR